MSQHELYEHRGYLADERKAAAYRAALAETVRPDDVVLDLGTGTGLLGYLACDAGAKSVIAVDRGDILELAQRIAADNGYGHRITHIKSLSTETELDTPVDVVVCDQIGGLVHDAGILSCFADARRRFLAPGGRLLPASFRIFVAPVTFDIGREAVEFWSSKPASLDVSAARPMAANTEWKYNIVADDLVRLSPGRELAAFPSDHEDPISGTAAFTVDQAGRFDGFIGWFEAQMSPSVTLTNDPWSPDRFDRWCNFYPVDGMVDLATGEGVRLRLDIRPRSGTVSWTTDVIHGDGRKQSFRHSTFLATSKADLAGPSTAITRAERVDLAKQVLDLIDGSRTLADIVTAMSSHVGSGFTSRSHLESFVRKVTTLGQ